MKSYFYDDFGNLWGSWGGIANRYLYTGQEYDSDIVGSELYNLRARYYDPKVGRFTSEDPMLSYFSLHPQFTNPYPYTYNNPLNWIDRSGKWCTERVETGEPQVIDIQINEGEYIFQGIVATSPAGGEFINWKEYVGVTQLYCKWIRVLTITTVKLIPQRKMWQCWHECFGLISGEIPAECVIEKTTYQNVEPFLLPIPYNRLPHRGLDIAGEKIFCENLRKVLP